MADAQRTRQGLEKLLPETIEVLGMDDQMTTYIWATDTRRLWRFPKLRELDRLTLIQMAGQEAVRALTEQELFDATKNAIAELSRTCVFGPDDFYGQGLWRLGGGEGVLVVAGDRAAVIKPSASGPTVREIESPVVDGKLIEFDGGKKWANLDTLIRGARAISDDRAKAAALWGVLMECLACWGFAGQHDREIIAGLIAATPLQAALPFRPHAWVKGATNTGKTALIEFLSRLWPHATRVESETTEAAVRQEIRHGALPLLMDEFEAWRGRSRVMRLLRAATRGGQVVKGTPSGRPIRFTVRHLVWVAAIDADLRGAADRNRFVVVELLLPERIEIDEPHELADLGLALTAAAIALADEIRDGWQRLSSSERHWKYGRLLEAYALPVAVQAALRGMDDDEADELLDVILAQQEEELAVQLQSDHEELVAAICSAAVRARALRPRRGGRRSDVEAKDGYFPVGDLLRDNTALDELNRVGIRPVEGDRVFISPKVVQRALLQRTKWAEVNISDVLARAPGACRARRRAGGVNAWGIEVPREALPLGDGPDGPAPARERPKPD